MTFKEKLAARRKKQQESNQTAEETKNDRTQEEGQGASAKDAQIDEKAKMSKVIEELTNSEVALYRLKKAVMEMAKGGD